MPLEQAAIVPHPPILIPSIGRENQSLLSKTITSYSKLKESLKNNKIETILIISSHGCVNPGFFSINEADEFEVGFHEFGDYSTKMSIRSNKNFIRELKDGFSPYQKVQFVNNQKLEHGHGVPICSLLPELKDIKVVPIYVSGLSLKEHFNFGKKLKTIIDKERKGVAVIASGDLSHTLTKKAPAGYSSRAARFDQKLTEYIQNKKVGDILNLKEELVNEVKPCGLKPIAILLGILKGTNYKIENQTYEAPFGVGYLTMQINITNPSP